MVSVASTACLACGQRTVSSQFSAPDYVYVVPVTFQPFIPVGRHCWRAVVCHRLEPGHYVRRHERQRVCRLSLGGSLLSACHKGSEIMSERTLIEKSMESIPSLQ